MVAMSAPSPSSSSVQLEHWNSVLAPLTEKERASVNLLAEWVEKSARTTVTTTVSGDAAGASEKPVNGNVAVSADKEQSQQQPLQISTDSALASPNKDATVPSLPTAPLVDAPSYLSWYAQQQALIAASTHTGHAKALQDITRAADEADALLGHLEAARIHIAELRAGARMVEEGTEGLREDAESMVERIDHLSALAEALSLRLSYFAILPSSTSFLSSPTLSLVTTSEFFLTLDRLDVALAFVRAHPHYRDASLYKMRFEHCVVRAGTLMRMYTVGRLKELLNDVSTQLKEWEKSRYTKGKEKQFDADEHVMMNLGDPYVSSLLFERFKEGGAQLRPVLQELEKRASFLAPPASTDIDSVGTDALPSSKGKQTHSIDKQSDDKGETNDANQAQQQQDEEKDDAIEVFRAPEFASLLEECRTAYFDARRTLLSSIIANCIARIEVMAQHPGAEQQQAQADAAAAASTSRAAANTATARMVDRGMAFLTAVNAAESELYAAFFGTSTDNGHSVRALHGHLRMLSAPLDDRLRPRLASEGGLAGLPAATLRSLDAWREYFVRFLG